MTHLVMNKEKIDTKSPDHEAWGVRKLVEEISALSQETCKTKAKADKLTKRLYVGFER